MRDLILALSILALIIAGIWVFNSGFDYEPLIVFIMGIVGLLYHFFNKPDDKPWLRPSFTQSSNSGQNVNVNVSVGDTTESERREAKGKTRKRETAPREALIDSMKNKVQILFIDDDKKFSVVKILKDSGWKNTKSVVDIKSVDVPVVNQADIFFVDINGVGKILNCEYEGLDLALMLKQKYPKRKVVIYSANKNNNVFHEAWDKCDFKLEKNALPYQFQNLVEQYSLDLFNQNQ